MDTLQIFSNQPLGPKPHIAIFASNKVGNFVITTPLLRGLKEKYPDCTLDFFGSEITKDFEIRSPHIDWRFSLYNDSPAFLETLTEAIQERRQIAGAYDLAINCDEFSEINLVMVTALRPSYIVGAGLSADFRQRIDTSTDPIQRILLDKDWDSPAFLARYPGILNSNYISEIFARISYVNTDFFKLELPSQPPSFSVPDVLIHVTATRPAKMWPQSHWKTVIQWCDRHNLTIGLVGSSPQVQQERYHSADLEQALLTTTPLIDLRGKTSLVELAGALKQTKVCITIDAGPLHIAAAVGCPTVALFGNDAEGNGASPLRLWAPRQPHVKLALSRFTCTLCQEQHYGNKACLIPEHPCMDKLSPQDVINHVSILIHRDKT
jgi:ADP-heptose:LPS heptosyltransferase